MWISVDKAKYEESFDEMYSSLCAGAVTLRVARIDTKTKHQDSTIYEADRIYFRTTKQHTYIRESYTGEFDFSPSSSVNIATYPTLDYQSVPKPNELLIKLRKLIPKLWILVMDIGEGVHNLTTIYRGDAMWKVEEREGIDVAVLRTPSDLSEALSKVQQREGMDETAFKLFYDRYKRASAFEAATMKGTIH